MTESSPRQETAVSGTDNDGKESSVECPTCERDDFKNKHGMRIHHAQAHGESISWTTVQCDSCGEEIETEKYELENQENMYCSVECQHNGYRNKKPVKCEYCGDIEEIIPARVPTHRFCSEQCKSNHEAETWQGKNGPNYRGRVTKECRDCGEEMELCPSLEHREFCSVDCFGNWVSKNHNGENHPNWSGGWSDYYGPNWHEQRRAARIRDQSRCQSCRATPLDTGEELSVHHIQPIRKFKNKYEEPKCYELANSLDNLICFCRPCHHRWEGIPLKPQLTD